MAHDLHSTNHVVAIINKENERMFEKRLNRLP